MSGVRFELRDPKPGNSPAIVVTAVEPTLLLAVSADGEVEVFTAHDSYDDADALVDQLAARDDIGAAVRLLIRASEARPA